MEDLTPQAVCSRPEPLYAIAERLDVLGCAGWLPVITRWLSRYHGLQGLLPQPADHPCAQVLELLQGLTPHPADELLAQRLARLDFLSWRVCRDGCERWNALDMPLCQYLGADAPRAWQWDSEYPPAADTEAWLLAELARARALASHPA